MRTAMTPLRLLGLLLAAPLVLGQNETGNHPDWPRWCGKVYESGYPSFNPGGQTVEPAASPDAPLLYVQVMPRYNLYLEGEAEGEFIVRTSLSSYNGKPLPSGAGGSGDECKDAKLAFRISLDGSDTVLASGTATSLSSDTVAAFALKGLTASLTAQNVTLTGSLASPDGSSKATYTATCELQYLPEVTEGSVTRLDMVHGGFLFRSDKTGGEFVPYFPYGYYASYDGFLGNVNSTATAEAVIGEYAGYGLSGMTPLSQYPLSQLAFDYMESIDLRYQFDLREDYGNTTWVAEQVTAAHTNAALFSYWSSDEPDGHQDPFAEAIDCRDTIRSIDPYHPVAVVLNCQNYYFGPYTQGADVIMEDAYPIGINSTYSKWGTYCNATLGDCGCDNCIGGYHAIQDVRDRLDDLARYETWLGLWHKTKLHNPQSFNGEGYWARDPTAFEEWAMALIAVNHGAQGIISWVYPAATGLSVIHGQLAQVLSTAPVVDFIVANDVPQAVAVAGAPDVDVAYWRRGAQLLVSVTNGGYGAVQGPVSISLPGLAAGGLSIASVPWGNLTWTVDGGKLSTSSIGALDTSLIILDV